MPFLGGGATSVLNNTPTLPFSQGHSCPCPGFCHALHPGLTQLAQMDSSVSSNAMVTLISKQHLERGPVTSVSPLETPNMKIKEEEVR